MGSAIIALLNGLLVLVPSLTGSAALGNVITALVGALPSIVQAVSDAVPIVKNIIAALQNHADITQEQWDALAKLNADCDAGFEGEAGAFNPDGSLKTGQ